MPKLSQNIAASKRQQAYSGLRHLLIFQQIEPGSRLREPEWAARLGVHRSALREAFPRLEAEGLIERGPQTGYFVPRLTPEDVAEVTKIRLALECLAIDEICAGKPRKLNRLSSACKELLQFLKGGYWLGVMEADRRFHEALIDAAGMSRLSAVYARAPLPLIQRVTQDQQVWQKECQRTLAEHQKILAALSQQNATEAKRVLQIHLSQRLAGMNSSQPR